MDDLRDLSLDRLDSELTELTAHLNAATCRWLCLVAELDRREIWGDWGAKTSAHWLAWRCGLSASAARRPRTQASSRAFRDSEERTGIGIRRRVPPASQRV